jgi:hypothetical protein
MKRAKAVGIVSRFRNALFNTSLSMLSKSMRVLQTLWAKTEIALKLSITNFAVVTSASFENS